MMNRNHITLLGAVLIFTLTIYGCATFNPLPIEKNSFLERTQKKTMDNISITVSVLSASESKEVFDLDLYRKGIQPIWVL